jgi:hypothetical protein
LYIQYWNVIQNTLYIADNKIMGHFKILYKFYLCTCTWCKIQLCIINQLPVWNKLHSIYQQETYMSFYLYTTYARVCLTISKYVCILNKMIKNRRVAKQCVSSRTSHTRIVKWYFYTMCVYISLNLNPYRTGCAYQIYLCDKLLLQSLKHLCTIIR